MHIEAAAIGKETAAEENWMTEEVWKKISLLLTDVVNLITCAEPC
jgi:hypothetical protein